MPLDLRFEKEVPAGFGKTVLEVQIESTLARKSEVLLKVLDELKKHGLVRSKEDEIHIRYCVDEAIANAILHGNRLDRKKNVFVTVYLSDDMWGVRVEDQGKGFSPDMVPDPDDPQSLLLEHGRGILIMKAFMDEVKFYRNGCGLLMTKKRPRK
ncbi:MAG: ATP-binding protein [Planctomycetota bacterium]|nr:ATP-binding protein [Planctomycetota bacterium]